MGRLHNYIVNKEMPDAFPGQRTDTGAGPVVPFPTGVKSVVVYAARRDRFDDPAVPRVRGSVGEAASPRPLQPSGDLTGWVPADTAMPTVLAGLGEDGKVFGWTGAKDSAGRAATFFAIAGDHYSGTRAERVPLLPRLPHRAHVHPGRHPGAGERVAAGQATRRPAPLVEGGQSLVQGVLQVVVQRVRPRLQGRRPRLLAVEEAEAPDRLQPDARVVVVDLGAEQAQRVRDAVAPVPRGRGSPRPGPSARGRQDRLQERLVDGVVALAQPEGFEQMVRQ